jgi:hypothetical protein
MGLEDPLELTTSLLLALQYPADEIVSRMCKHIVFRTDLYQPSVIQNPYFVCD